MVMLRNAFDITHICCEFFRYTAVSTTFKSKTILTCAVPIRDGRENVSKLCAIVPCKIRMCLPFFPFEALKCHAARFIYLPSYKCTLIAILPLSTGALFAFLGWCCSSFSSSLTSSPRSRLAAFIVALRFFLQLLIVLRPLICVTENLICILRSIPGVFHHLLCSSFKLWMLVCMHL